MQGGMRFHVATSFPTHMDDLEDYEKLIVGAFRRCLVATRDSNPKQWLLVWNELGKELGRTRAKEVIAALIRIMREIHDHARGPVEYHQPCCPYLATDERRILALKGACQRADWQHANGLAECLVTGEGAPGLVLATVGLAALLQSGGGSIRGVKPTVLSTSAEAASLSAPPKEYLSDAQRGSQKSSRRCQNRREGLRQRSL